jgi:hypothetical protein
MDGLPGMKRGLTAAKTYNVSPIKKMVGPLAPTRYQAGLGFNTSQVLLIALLSFLIGLAVSTYGQTAMTLLSETAKGSPLEVHVGNWTTKSPVEGLSGLWATR